MHDNQHNHSADKVKGQTMSRYVDINRLEPQQFENSEVELGVLAYDYESVQSEPYIDIVRCKECKQWKKGRVDFSNCELMGIVRADDFCSYGEREGE